MDSNHVNFFGLI